MEKLNGKKKYNVSVLISGRGTNLKSLINFSKKKILELIYVWLLPITKTQKD